MTEGIISERDIYTARLRAVDKSHGFPCLSYALMSLIPVITEKIDRLGTDKWWRVYVNPKFFAGLTADQGAMVLVHEAWHLLSDHWVRADRFGVRPDEQMTWNIAGDCEINTKDELWKRLPNDCIRPELYKFPNNLLAEEYFKLLKELPGFGGSGISVTVCAGQCGSCSHGYEGKYEEPGPGGGSDIPVVTGTRAKIIMDETAQRIIDDATNSIGNVPAGWVRWAKKILKPEVDWRIYLRSAIQGVLASITGHTIPTFRKMARRQFKYPDFIIPAYQDPIPHVAVIIDTSGSMSDEYVAQGIAEVDGILMSVGSGVKVDVYFTDAAAHGIQRVTSASTLVPYGGGGTDMGAGFQAIDDEAKKDPSTLPALIVVVTDGYTPWPEKAPPYAQVCIVLVANGTHPTWAVPPLHSTIRIKDARKQDDG